ncbi:MAG: hypothetical protein ACI8WT_003302 [Clostridium sp.]
MIVYYIKNYGGVIMSEVKTTSFRVQEDDIKKFKGFAKANDLNQDEMVTALIYAFDLASVRGQMFNTEKEDKSKLKYELKYEVKDYENSFI